MATGKGKLRGGGMRALLIPAMLTALIFGFGAFLPGQASYAEQHVEQQQQESVVIQVIKQDQKGNPVKGATMELWRVKIPDEFNPYPYVDYEDLLQVNETNKINEKYTGLVDKWVTDGKTHVVDLTKYYPPGYSLGTRPHNFTYEDERYYHYTYGVYPFIYMLVETSTPEGYMTAQKTFFRVDPSITNTYYGYTDGYMVKTYRSDPRKEKIESPGPGILTHTPITAVDEEAPLLIDKLDENGNHLEGAELELLDDQGKPVMGADGKPVKWISSGKTDKLLIKRPGYPEKSIPDYKSGPVEYTIHEISAPAGYDKSDDVTFTLYPCGKWDYQEGSEPAIGHKPLENNDQKTNVNQAPIPAPCPPPGCDFAPVSVNGTATVIPYSHKDAVRIINFKVREKNGVKIGDFTINKTDQERQPLSEVAFEVYAKPTLTTSVDVDITKHWEYEGATTVTGSIGPDTHALTIPGGDVDVSLPKVEGDLPDTDVPEPLKLLTREGNEPSFPYDYMANLTPKVTVRDGKTIVPIKSEKAPTPLKDILGSAFDQAQNNGKQIAGENVTDDYGNVFPSLPYWYYQGSADEKLGTITLKDGDSLLISETMEGSLKGETAKVERTVTVTEWVYGNNGYEEKEVDRTIKYIDGKVTAGGVGTLNVTGDDQYNKFDRPIPSEVLRAFYPRMSGNLVRHIAPQPIRVEFKDGKLTYTDGSKTYDITGSRTLTLTNIVQWRTEGSGAGQQEQEKCPPKCK